MLNPILRQVNPNIQPREKGKVDTMTLDLRKEGGRKMLSSKERGATFNPLTLLHKSTTVISETSRKPVSAGVH